MVTLIDKLRKIKVSRHSILGDGILEVTAIISSPYPGASVVLGLCRATFDRRLLVGETEESVLAQIEQVIAQVKKKIPEMNAHVSLASDEETCWTGKPIRAKRFFPAWLVDKDSAFVQKARQGLEEVGIHAPFSHFSFCTNGSHFCGEKGIPTIGFGPSLENQAHVVDEYIEIDQLKKAYHGFYGILSKLTQE